MEFLYQFFGNRDGNERVMGRAKDGWMGKV